ncbi:MAG: response regulator transcription factor [Microvirga sp.]|nr:response regulator transcription factor [Microvirga sp.]
MEGDAQTTIVIADDHPLFRGALRQAITSFLPTARIVEAGDLDRLGQVLRAEGEVDLVLLDLAMPGAQGFSGLIYLRAQHPSTPVVIVSGSEDAAVMRRAIAFGASGFIPKSLDIEKIGEALAAVLAGAVWTLPDLDMDAPEDDEAGEIARRLATLTPQQVRVLMMLSEGLLNKQIAYELAVSEATVKAHVSAILQKLGVDSRTQAVILAAKVGVASRAASAA